MLTLPASNPVKELQDRLRQPSQRSFRSRMAPSLAYGRHRGPALTHSRLAAVTIAIYRDKHDRWVIPLTLRPDSLQHHGGQICLPGGRVEQGETVVDAALREFEEELGVCPTVLTHCGELSTQYVYGSDNLVYPVIVAIEHPGPWIPDPREVAEVILLPVATMIGADNRTVMQKQKQVVAAAGDFGQLTFRAPAIELGNHRIWGVTALILDELAQLLHS